MSVLWIDISHKLTEKVIIINVPFYFLTWISIQKVVILIVGLPIVNKHILWICFESKWYFVKPSTKPIGECLRNKGLNRLLRHVRRFPVTWHWTEVFSTTYNWLVTTESWFGRKSDDDQYSICITYLDIHPRISYSISWSTNRKWTYFINIPFEFLTWIPIQIVVILIFGLPIEK